MRPFPVFFLATLWCFPEACGQTRLSVQQAVNKALESHPALQSAGEKIGVYDALARQAAVKPNPRATLQVENLRAHGDPGFVYGRDADTYAFLSRTLTISGKRERRMEVASGDRERARLERELLARQIAERVQLAYWNAAAAQRVRELLRDSLRTFAQIVDYHRHRVKEGAMAEADLIRVQLESDRLELTANTAALEAERARIHLLREMGEPEFPALILTDALESGIPEQVPADPAAALEQRIEMQLARRAVEQAKAGQRLQQSLGRPDPEAILGYKRAAGFNTLVAGIQWSLPIADRNQGNIAAAGAEVRVAESHLRATAAMIRAEVDAARTEYEIRRRQVKESLKPLMERASESAQIAVAAYREGGADLLRLLDAERTLIDVQTIYVKTLAEYRQAIVTLQYAMGVLP